MKIAIRDTDLASVIAAPIWALCCPSRWRLPRPSRMVPRSHTSPGPPPARPPGGVIRPTPPPNIRYREGAAIPLPARELRTGCRCGRCFDGQDHIALCGGVIMRQWAEKDTAESGLVRSVTLRADGSLSYCPWVSIESRGGEAILGAPPGHLAFLEPAEVRG